MTTRIYASDEVEYFVFLRSLWFDHDVSFENEYRHIYESGIARPPGFLETFLERRTETGRRINFGTIGCALLWSPFYAAGDFTARALRAAGVAVAVDGYSKPYVSAVAYASAVYGCLSIVLSILVCRRLFGWTTAPSGRFGRIAPFLAVVIVWIGTPLVFYMYVTPPMAHATSAFTVALFVLAWLKARERWRVGDIALLAAIAALMGMVREQDLLLAIGPILDFARDLARRREGAWRATALKLATAAVVFGIVFVPQALAYLALNGRIGPSQFVTRKMIWSSPHALQVLASPAHGFFWWTPLAAVAIGGLIWAAASRRNESMGWLAACLLAMVAAEVYVNGSVDSWTLAGAFGQRRFVSLTPILCVGLSAVITSLAHMRPPWRVAAAAAIGLTVWWNVALMVQFGTGLMDRQRLQPALNARHAFMTVPRELPSLVYRYLFERGTFYK
ncbi:MAG: hypothetical protein HYZ58_17130 [Acidobacteria bacterium]|nr:hypothetical protein [Acidobacteriota bacterium]